MTEKGLVDGFELYRRRKPSTTIVVKRNIVEPTLFRNSNSDRAETQEFGDELHAQMNGEKFVSKERLTGLDLLRKLDDGESLISEEYTYNEPADFAESVNMDSLTYGLAGTGDQDFAIKSRVIAGYTYTTEEYDLMNKETRNAVYESGTMRNEEGEQSQALFDYVKVQPGNSLVHFLTIESGTEEMLLYALHNVLNTKRYGARETRTGKNVQNEILSVIQGEHDTSLSTGELLLNYHEYGAGIEESIAAYLQNVRKPDWDIYSDEMDQFEDLPNDLKGLIETASREDEAADDDLRSRFEELTADAKSELNLD